ncbi:hypothetical protein CPB83DRAFT_131726 [Crepidotus variabilis]|uniref:Glycosyl hydrolase family 92 N-terminal domain-containing protein n=1 Tax=Crepidotus variabilis TaxID=179855 RepID=A0A9P6EK65_9AGAR|nr:hypothetical protein CPB83DRAFT_131726 [Crepidotus variabilis]
MRSTRDTLTYSLLLLSFVASAPTNPSASAQVGDPASFVVPFIGTVSGGHVFPGATLPHGMVKAGMDTDSPENHAGYDGNPRWGVTGFSQLHDDGTGGSPPLSNFKLYPHADCASLESCQTSIFTRRVYRESRPDGSPDDAASPGYFSTNLTTGVRVELTATRRTALHRYTYHPGTKQPRILVDFTNDGGLTGVDPEGTVDPKGRISGGARFAGSFGPGWYKAFTCVDFKGEGYDIGEPVEYGVFTDNTVHRNQTDIGNNFGRKTFPNIFCSSKDFDN